MILKVPMYFWIVGRLDVKRIAAAKWFRVAKESAFFVFCGHFFFCSIWIHLAGGCFRDWTVGSYLLPLALFMGPGLATTMLVARRGRGLGK